MSLLHWRNCNSQREREFSSKPGTGYLSLSLGHSQHLKLIQRPRGFHDDHWTSDKHILCSLSESMLAARVIFLVVLYYSHKMKCVRQLSPSTTPECGLGETSRSSLFRINHTYDSGEGQPHFFRSSPNSTQH